MIQKQLVDKLALKLLEGEFGPGDVVRVDALDGEVVFEKAAAPRHRTGDHLEQASASERARGRSRVD